MREKGEKREEGTELDCVYEEKTKDNLLVDCIGGGGY